MKVVELRRHTERDANEDLTPNGLEIAAKARKTLEFPYDAYYVSQKKRAHLTLEAFGVRNAIIEPRLDARPRPPFAPFEAKWNALMANGLDAVTAWFSIPEAVPTLTEYGRRALAGVLDIAASLPQGGRALAVSHGWTIEPFAVVAIGRPYATLFGSAELRYCEGVKAFIHDGAALRVDIVRLPP